MVSFVIFSANNFIALDISSLSLENTLSISLNISVVGQIEILITRNHLKRALANRVSTEGSSIRVEGSTSNSRVIIATAKFGLPIIRNCCFSILIFRL